MPEPRVHVAPPASELYEPVCAAICEAGGRVVPASDANAMVWLGQGDSDMRAHMTSDMVWVQLRAAGVDKWIRSGEIDDSRLFTGARGAYTGQVAEHAVALLFAASKELRHYTSVRRWRQEGPFEARRLAGRSLLLIGAGSIGAEIIRLLAPLGMEVAAMTRSGRAVEGACRSLPVTHLHASLPQADYVLLVAPGVEANRHMIGEAELALMAPHAWLINVGRGTLVDTAALVTALREKRIAGAALDVVDPEPLPDDHPLWSEARCLITPHRANPPSEFRRSLMAHIGENVRRFAADRPLLGAIDVELGY